MPEIPAYAATSPAAWRNTLFKARAVVSTAFKPILAGLVERSIRSKACSPVRPIREKVSSTFFPSTTANPFTVFRGCVGNEFRQTTHRLPRLLGDRQHRVRQPFRGQIESNQIAFVIDL